LKIIIETGSKKQSKENWRYEEKPIEDISPQKLDEKLKEIIEEKPILPIPKEEVKEEIKEEEIKPIEFSSIVKDNPF